MKRTATLAAFTVSILVLNFSASARVSAQVVAYGRHSTAFGDYAAGAAELVQAQGQYLVNQSVAAQNFVQATAASDQLQYQRTEYRYQVKQLELKYVQDRADANRQRQNLKSASDEAAARQLVQSAKRGFVQWPTALTQPKYASSMTLIDSILRNWTPEDSTGDAYRRALATEAGVLRARVANDRSINFPSRVEAVKTLAQLQLLAISPGTDESSSANGPQLAMR